MARLDDVCNALVSAITSAVNNAGVPGSQFVNSKGVTVTVQSGNIYRGNPLVPEIVNIFAGGDGLWQINVFPGKAKPTTRFSPNDMPVVKAPSTVTLTVDNNNGALTFGGTPSSANVHTIINGLADAAIQVNASQSLATISSNVASAVNTLAFQGVTANSSGAVATISGAHSVVCNIAGTTVFGGSVSYEVARFERDVQITVWATDPYTRSSLEEAIEENVGTTLQTFLELPDGTGMYVSNVGVEWDDDSQSSYGVYIGHLGMTVEYGVMQVQATAQLAAVENIVAKNVPATIYVG